MEQNNKGDIGALGCVMFDRNMQLIIEIHIIVFLLLRAIYRSL